MPIKLTLGAALKRKAILSTPAFARENAADLFSPSHQEGLRSLLQRIYKKPVELNLTPLSRAHLNAEILSKNLAHQLQDRTANIRRVILEATVNAQLPDERMVTAMRQARAQPANTVSTATVQASSALSAFRTPTSEIVKSLNLSQVSSVAVTAKGRLTKRLSANQAMKKEARRGASSKGPSHMGRGWLKSHERYANGTGKRRTGALGVKVKLGHS